MSFDLRDCGAADKSICSACLQALLVFYSRQRNVPASMPLPISQLYWQVRAVIWEQYTGPEDYR